MSELNIRPKPYIRWLALIPLVLSGLWFQILEDKILIPEYLLHTRLDDYIPFMPLFVIPYVLWYAYVAVPAVYLFWKSHQDFLQMAYFLAFGMFIACTVYTLFPNGQALRPVLRGEIGALSRLLLGIYKIDTPTNSAPSIHVIYSVAAHAAITRYNNQHLRIVPVNFASLIISVLCIISTVFVKQHSVIDMMAGLFVSGLLWSLIYGAESLAENEKRRLRQEQQLRKFCLGIKNSSEADSYDNADRLFDRL